MEIKVINSELSIAPQLTVADLHQIAEMGYKSIVCNRPDGEAPDQPEFAAIKLAADRLGMMSCYQPVESGKVTRSDAARLEQVLSELPAPVLAYCRTGSRTKHLWTLMTQSCGADASPS